MTSKTEKPNPYTKKAYMFILGGLAILGMVTLFDTYNMLRSDLLFSLFLAFVVAAYFYLFRSEWWKWKTK
jgi:hypothetical protein